MLGLSLMLSAVCARADSVVVFNEIMYHPLASEATMEWVELHNQMAVDVDLSGWSIGGGVDFAFAEGTVIPGGGYLVVAASPAALASATGLTNVFGPFTGRLSNDGEKLELRNRNNRLMDSVTYGVDGDWPVGPDGAGVSLAKREREHRQRAGRELDRECAGRRNAGSAQFRHQSRSSSRPPRPAHQWPLEV